MECEEVLARLWEYLDQELGPEEARSIRVHLSGCTACHPAYCVDRAFLQLLAQLRSNYSAPASLRVRVRTRLMV